MKPKKRQCGAIILAIYLFVVISASFASEMVLINRPFSEKDHRNDYPKELLGAALEITKESYGDFQIQYSNTMGWERLKVMLKEGQGIDVLQAATRANWEKELLPIRVPIMKGLLGHRIFLINKQSIDMFAAIDSLDELKELRAGLGRQWSITSVFKQNGFNIVTGTDYEGLFKMLVSDRFDYFPRGINEAPEEYVQRKHLLPDLHIETSLLLHLPLPVYFFVTPTKPKLAERIEKGLNMMIRDGSFDTLFFKYHKEIFESIGIHKRKVFKIANPNLTLETPLDRKELWLDISEIPGS